MYKSLYKRKIPRKSLHKKRYLKLNRHNIITTQIYFPIDQSNQLIANLLKNTKNMKVFVAVLAISLMFLYVNYIENTYSNTIDSSKASITTDNKIDDSNSLTPTISNITTTSTTSTTTTTTTTTTTVNTLKIETLKDAQEQLKNLFIYQGKIDGINGTYTNLSIKEFQRRAGLEVDGILGPITKEALSIGTRSYINIDNLDIVDLDNYIISEETMSIQLKLADLKIYTGDLDGIFGFQTKLSLEQFQRKAGLEADGVYGPKTSSALDKGEDSYIQDSVINNNDENVKTMSSTKTVTSSNNSTSTVDLINYNPNATCIIGYINNQNIWVPDPCFYPVFVFRYGNVAQVNSQAELDAYLNQNWSLTKEKTYSSLGKVPTQNYSDGYNSPVNGLPMPSGSNNSIVIGIKNDNNVRARPQSGPQAADAVVEVLVEGGMTRFINIFYQSDTSYHGPIRSARPTDPTVLRPVGGVLVASGATGGLIPEIVDMGVPVISDRRPEYFRISSRSAPHNLYADTAKLKQHALNKGYKKYLNPQPLFPWGNPSQNNWKSNSYLKLTFSSYTSTTWTWNGSSYARTYYDAYKNSSNDNIHYWIDKNGNQGQITTTTVIALFCEPYVHPLQLPSVKTVGEGRAIILHKGKLLDARWKRGSNLDPFHIVDNNDNILYVPKGKVWISLVPNTKNPSFG